ncbi:MAG: nucleotidyl transferase AbiEii/AbiGii toxin family protein [Candidatus Stygibacter australis]|nr:nucleotidyl transferase AbiEii/AbiGii toxin family protein [Candidatus Stygibacter australis]
MEYNMNLHIDQNLFSQALLACSQKLGIPAIYIKKDYWVTYVLQLISRSEVNEFTILKGGTSLSKCFDLIKRFSEDIDLVIIKNAGDTSNTLKRKLKLISKVVSHKLPEENVAGITNKKGVIRKTVHVYPKTAVGAFGQVKDKIIIEATCLGSFEPYNTTYVNSYIFDMLKTNGQMDMADKFDLMPFKIKILDPERTICEKIMSLVRFSYEPDPVNRLKEKIRHFYDLYMLISNSRYSTFLESDEFEKLLIIVAETDIQSFKHNNAWLANHPVKALIFSDTLSVAKELKVTYEKEFRNLIYGDFPDYQDIIDNIIKIKNRIQKIRWHINLET